MRSFLEIGQKEAVNELNAAAKKIRAEEGFQVLPARSLIGRGRHYRVLFENLDKRNFQKGDTMESHLKHPVNQFRLIRRYHKDWPYIRKLLGLDRKLISNKGSISA